MVPLLMAAGVHPRVIDVYRTDSPTAFNEYSGGRLVIVAFPLTHDVENCGYKILYDNETVFYATDTPTLDGIDAPGYDLYLLEANHTEQEIADRINRKLEAGEYVYEYRVEVTHMSKETADAWLMTNAGPNSKVIYLHQHQERNTKK